MNADDIIQELGLEKHIEGGYFRRTFCSDQMTGRNTHQGMASSIYYLLTKECPIGHFHKNKSDILHFYHGDGVIRYHLIDGQGQHSTVEMGRELKLGQQLQLVVNAGSWKASELISGDFALISEVVVPEFRSEDMQLANFEQLKLWQKIIPNLARLIKK